MSEIQFVKRVVHIVEPNREEWSNVISRSGTKLTFLKRFKLLFKPYRETLAPKGYECAITTMSGNPIYQYKELDGKTYYIKPAPSPGFPEY